MLTTHTPVLLKEVITALAPSPGETFVDGTVGGGGHASAIVERLSPDGVLIGIDLDNEAVELVRTELSEKLREEHLDVRVEVVHGNFKDLVFLVEERTGEKLDGLLLDLGLSSDQLSSGAGFSFQADEPLVMRYDRDKEALTAAKVINEFSEEKLAEILEKYGEEKFARRIAKAVVEQRKKKLIVTTAELVDVIKSSLPSRYRPKLHPATRTFLALRVFVNYELGNLEAVLAETTDIMKDGGRVAVISFQSLEDRIVKQSFRRLVEEGKGELINKKPITPGAEEIRENPRARSAKLRAIKISCPS